MYNMTAQDGRVITDDVITHMGLQYSYPKGYVIYTNNASPMLRRYHPSKFYALQKKAEAIGLWKHPGFYGFHNSEGGLNNLYIITPHDCRAALCNDQIPSSIRELLKKIEEVEQEGLETFVESYDSTVVSKEKFNAYVHAMEKKGGVSRKEYGRNPRCVSFIMNDDPFTYAYFEFAAGFKGSGTSYYVQGKREFLRQCLQQQVSCEA